MPMNCFNATTLALATYSRIKSNNCVYPLLRFNNRKYVKPHKISCLMNSIILGLLVLLAREEHT